MYSAEFWLYVAAINASAMGTFGCMFSNFPASTATSLSMSVIVAPLLSKMLIWLRAASTPFFLPVILMYSVVTMDGMSR